MHRVSALIEAIMFVTMMTAFTLLRFIWMAVRLPVRFAWCSWRGHMWLYLGNGFFGMFASKRNFECAKCGFKTGDPQNYKTVEHQRGSSH